MEIAMYLSQPKQTIFASISMIAYLTHASTLLATNNLLEGIIIEDYNGEQKHPTVAKYPLDEIRESINYAESTPIVPLIDKEQVDQESEEDWVLVPQKIEVDVDEQEKIRKAQKKALKRAGGIGTLHPDAKGYRAQRRMRGIRNGICSIWAIAEPFALTTIVRVGVDVTLGKLGPTILEYAGGYAEDMASTTISSFAKLDPTGVLEKFTRSSARAVAIGETMRRLGEYADRIEKYTIPILKSVSQLTSLGMRVISTEDQPSAVENNSKKNNPISSTTLSNKKKDNSSVDKDWVLLKAKLQDEKVEESVPEETISSISHEEFIEMDVQLSVIKLFDGDICTIIDGRSYRSC